MNWGAREMMSGVRRPVGGGGGGGRPSIACAVDVFFFHRQRAAQAHTRATRCVCVCEVVCAHTCSTQTERRIGAGSEQPRGKQGTLALCLARFHTSSERKEITRGLCFPFLMQARPTPTGRTGASPAPPGLGHCRLSHPPGRAAPERAPSAGARPACRPTQPRPAAGPPAWSQQNTPNPLALPDPALSAPAAVTAQVTALATNDTPWPGHGIQTAYAFARDTGALELSTYFRPRGGDAPLRRSLYHEVCVCVGGGEQEGEGATGAGCVWAGVHCPRSLPFPFPPPPLHPLLHSHLSLSLFHACLRFSSGPLRRHLCHLLPRVAAPTGDGLAPNRRRGRGGRPPRRGRAP